MRYEVTMIEKATCVIEADNAIQVGKYISTHSIEDIKRERNLDLDVQYDDTVVGVTIKPADFSIKEN